MLKVDCTRTYSTSMLEKSRVVGKGTRLGRTDGLLKLLPCQR